MGKMGKLSVISKYRKMLNITPKELGRGGVSEETIRLLENGKRKLTIPTAAILIKNLNEIAQEKGMVLNLSIQDIMLSERDYAQQFCQEKLNELGKKEVNLDDYKDLLNMAEGYNFSEIIYNVSEIIAETLFYNNEFQECINYLKKASKYVWAHENKQKAPYIFNRIGACYSNIGDNINASTNFEESYKYIVEFKINDIELKSKVMYNLGLVYYNLKDYNNSLKMIDELLTLDGIDLELTKDPLIVKGNLLEKLDRKLEAIELYKDLLKRFNEDRLIYYNLSVIYYNIEDKEKSVEYANKLVEHIDEETPSTLMKLGNLYLERKMYRESIILFDKAILLSESFDQIEVSVGCYENIFYCYKQLNEISRFESFVEDILLNFDKILNDENLKSRVFILFMKYLNEYANSEVMNKVFLRLEGE